MPTLSVIIPVYNEAATLPKLLKRVTGVPVEKEILIVDDGSTDGTAVIAKECGARVIRNDGKGKGDAVRVGLILARHEGAVFIDADGSHEPADIPKLVAPIAAGQADLVIGSRILGGSEELVGSIAEVMRLMGNLRITRR